MAMVISSFLSNAKMNESSQNQILALLQVFVSLLVLLPRQVRRSRGYSTSSNISLASSSICCPITTRVTKLVALACGQEACTRSPHFHCPFGAVPRGSQVRIITHVNCFVTALLVGRDMAHIEQRLTNLRTASVAIRLIQGIDSNKDTSLPKVLSTGMPSQDLYVSKLSLGSINSVFTAYQLPCHANLLPRPSRYTRSHTLVCKWIRSPFFS